jgi:hypothetical protein
MPGARTDEHEVLAQKRVDWYRVGLWGAIAIMSYFLLTEHLAHVVYFLPFALLLACPFMHVFMHHGHSKRPEDEAQPRKPEHQEKGHH